MAKTAIDKPTVEALMTKEQFAELLSKYTGHCIHMSKTFGGEFVVHAEAAKALHHQIIKEYMRARQ